MPTDASWISRPWLQQSSEDLSLLCGFVEQISRYPCFAMDVNDLRYDRNNIRFPFPKPSHSTYAPGRPSASLPLNPPTILPLNHSSLNKPLHHDLQQRALLLPWLGLLIHSSLRSPTTFHGSINPKNFTALPRSYRMCWNPSTASPLLPLHTYNPKHFTPLTYYPIYLLHNTFTRFKMTEIKNVAC